MNLENYVKIIVTPLINVKEEISKEGQSTWYDSNMLKESLGDILTFDLVIVDGPSGDSTPFARYSAIPFLKDKISTSFSVFLDDTHRDEEIEIVNDWYEILGGKLKGYNRYYHLGNNIKYNTSPFGNKH